MHLFKGKLMTFITLGLVMLIFIALIGITVYSSDFRTDIESKSVTIDGKYSIDGTDWYPTGEKRIVNENFSVLNVIGKASKGYQKGDMLIMSVDNVWFDLYADGKTVATNKRDEEGPFQYTPGYSICYVQPEDISPDSELELYLYFPYQHHSNRNFGDFFDMYAGDEATAYELLFQHKGLTIFFCFLICFFGLFAFPIAGVVLGKIDYRYLTFGVLCFFSGIFILLQSIYSYLPLWIKDPILGMSINNAAYYLMALSALVYIKTNLHKSVNKIIGNIIISVFAALTVLATVLHLTGVSDLYATKPFMLIFLVICTAMLTMCLLTEVRENTETFMVMLSWIPLVIALLLDTVNDFVFFTTLPLFEIGAALTLVNQIVVLLIDLRKQYLESLRYQQMQKELYEAKVSLMVSQIQPHFLYNSLTSIAMMCTKDPKTARDATINFADYLRGNMNSLKEKNPVPFEKELEHLKKYLMLEKMRFGDMLNIEYDIRTTDFVIPQLSVQPLVENAVKHGVGMKEDGGTVTIATEETENAYLVIISDDGVGFDTSAPKKDDGRSHVGMENVKQRLKEMIDADVVIESAIGEGTVATIIIPKDKQEGEPI